ncbi:hypothetical protein ONE63_008150 [Megalurothrips usitatus]|uniref:CHK kinase-like domain-containing protein n=1 Tax=Megalurothrips usitatus TaxID=439358 RepID=A0AAV7XNL3_9NEOP|nr:hypothetical protein ONE63_008150 [Megalurothrips usitatus]
MAASGDLAVPRVVEAALPAIAAREGFTRPGFHVESGSNDGDGYMSVMYCIRVQNEDGDKDALHLVSKVTTPSAEGAPMMSRMFAAEGSVYSQLLPAMEEIAGMRAPLPWPRSYHVAVTGPPPHCLVLRDLRPDGFAMVDRKKPLDLQHCRLMLRAIARFHGAGMALQHLRPDAFRAMRDALGADLAAVEETANNFMRFLAPGQAVPDLVRCRFGEVVYAKLKDMFTNIPNEFLDFMLPDPEGGNTIVHGDFHLNNILYQYEKDTGAVQDCVLIDFQMARYGCPASDLLPMLMAFTDKALRDEHWQGLLRGYHDELQATLRAAGCEDPDAIYSWERLTVTVSSYSYKLGLSWLGVA